MDGSLNITSLTQQAIGAAEDAVDSWAAVWDSRHELPCGCPERASATPDWMWDCFVFNFVPPYLMSDEECDEILAIMREPFLAECQRQIVDHLGAVRWDDVF